ncbi:hypothetical protein CJ739_2142 [Mariniflexile rhizosphaerae]|uniref:hypothetical protein n=1 Tax=unclassified Mariniflexile TaxID=2643887 RepID=UPI000CB704C9|nr:hypothetical protein [Mariniflexile sp. TRM1-10]AXP81223.1 hypothetical protein CJ739_2142 [Mariniflexile sp. TRM1-10]PLB18838.1 MAG: hypothetical protein TRG1_2352 [Flavobacteriaceae bacterium FS1-H7996/R]
MTSRKIGNIEFTNINLLLSIGGILASMFFGYVFYRTYQSERSLISIMIIPLVLGIIFENKRLSTAWKTIALKILGAILLSVFAFIPGKREQNYNFENHIEMWPYWFIFFFVLISASYNEKKIVPKLTEGITLIQSISVIYWILDIGFLNFKNIFAYILMGIGLIFCAVSFIHAFSYMRLTRNFRLFLSIWSSIIMIIFAIDHIYRVFNFNYFVDYKTLNDGLNVLQYFLLGVSLIYIFQNAYMLLVYFPDKHSWYGKEQMRDIKKMNKTHLDRYSQNQIKISDSLIALTFISGFYYWNYKYQIMPRHTLIWLVFWLFPFIISGKEIINEKTKTTSIQNNC